MSTLETVLFMLPIVLLISVPLIWWLHDIKKHPNIHRVGRKEKYYILEETPMVLHKIFTRIGLPIGILVNLLSILSNFGALGTSGSIAIISLIYNVLYLVFAFLAHDRLRKMEWGGVKYLILVYGVTTAYQLVFFALEYFGIAYMENNRASSTIANIIIIVWAYRYYSKRRPLFSPIPKDMQPAIPTAQYETQEANGKQFVVDSSTGEVVSETSTETQEHVEQQKCHDSENNKTKAVNNEAYIYTKAANGVTVRIPRSKYAQWKATQEKIKAGTYKENPEIDGKQPEEKPIYSQLAPPNKKTRGLSPIGISIIGVLLCIAIGASGWIATYKANQQISNLQAELDAKQISLEKMESNNANLRAKIQTLQDTIRSTQEKVNTLEDSLVIQAPAAYVARNQMGFIVEGSRYYHQFDCDINQQADKFSAHNITYCEALGYPKCPDCWKSEWEKVKETIESKYSRPIAEYKGTGLTLSNAETGKVLGSTK